MSLRRQYVGCLLALLGGAIALLASPSGAQAAGSSNLFGQNINDGYYAQSNVIIVPGRTRSGVYVFEQGIVPNWQVTDVNLTSYLSTMSNRLAGAEVGTVESPETQQARAAAIIDMMLGQSGANYGGDWRNGVAYARANYNRWAGLVTQYDAAWKSGAVTANGTRWGVNFDDLYSNPEPNDNLGLFDQNDDGLYGPNPLYQRLPDLVFIGLGENIVNEDAVIFHHPDGTEFTLLKKCDNLTGDESPFPPSVGNWHLTSTASVDKASVYPGQTVNFKFNITNNGPDTGTISFGQRYQSYNGATAGSISNNPGADVMQSLAQGDSISSYTTYAYTIPANYTGNKYCGWIAYSPNGSDGGSGTSNQACVTVNQPAPSCNGASVNPTTGLNPSTAFTVTASIKFQDQPAAATAYASGSRLYVTVTGPGGYNQDSGDLATGPPAMPAISGTTPPFAPTGQTGKYTITYGMRGGIGTISACSSSFDVGSSPYFRIDGGDIVAGAGFVDSSGACAPAASADVKGYNKGSTGNYFGAGAQMAAIALGTLAGFPTSTNDDGSLSGVDGPNRTGLSFANTSSPVGNFASLPCSTDYVATALTTPGVQAGSNADLASLASGTLASGTYTFNGPITITGGSLPADRHITIIVLNGDVTLQNDIKYGAYGSVNDIPQFQLLIQNGSLLIASGVNELHGVYDVQSGSSAGSGTLDTCFTGATPTFVGCDNKLTFYGAVIAKTVLLHRTYGNLDAVGGVPAEPAETFQYTPELWAGPINPSGPSVQTYDAIISLPPVL